MMRSYRHRQQETEEDLKTPYTAELLPLSSVPDWDAKIQGLPGAHVLQSAEWGYFKARSTGWAPEAMLIRGSDEHIAGGALILTRRIGSLSVIYIAKGPMLDYGNTDLFQFALEQIEALARKRRVIWLKLDPDLPAGYGIPGTESEAPDPVGQNALAALKSRGWHFSDSQVQYRNTLIIDLTQHEDDILKQMSQSTRYKVRYGPKHGVTVRGGTLDDLPLLYQLYEATGKRDGFLTRPFSYYQDEWSALIKAGIAKPLIAELDGSALAHVILFRFGQTCWYFYGASSSEHRNLMPTYLLQWEAMRWAKANGCTRYDFWGAPDEFTEADPMWGVFRWKEGFGGKVARFIGAWDYVPYPPLYLLYTRAMPAILSLMKKLRGRSQS